MQWAPAHKEKQRPQARYQWLTRVRSAVTHRVIVVEAEIFNLHMHLLIKTSGQPRNLGSMQSSQARPHADNRDDLGTCAIKNSIWSARMRRLRKMKSSHRLGTYGVYSSGMCACSGVRWLLR